jgi:hypothetical protein
VDGVPCAGEGQSQLNFHSPFLADDQYLDWRYTRQWERDWTEVFLNFGNSTIVGTVGLQAWNLTDASYNNTDAQLGISQAYVTIKPKLTGRKRFEAKVGSFWNRYGGAGKYDAGKYDTYLYGRTHVMGEVLNGELDVGSFTLRLSHGFGAKTEQKTIGDTSPGFTLLNHVHAGVSYKKLVDLNAHYLVSWAQDGRATPQIPDGQIHVAGVETRITGGVYGELFAGYSHINAVHAQSVGPGLEVMHSMGGGGVNAANGLVENYFGPCAACKPVDRGSGQVNTVSLQYDYSFGTLWRRLRNPKEGFWGDGSDVTMSLFGMYTQVGSRDEKADGTEKLKFGTDVVYTAMSWMGVGLRADRVMPNSKDSEESFSVVSPKLIFRTKFVTHEEITAQYSKYWYGSKVRPLYPNQAALPDQNVFGIKATMWW